MLPIAPVDAHQDGRAKRVAAGSLAALIASTFASSVIASRDIASTELTQSEAIGPINRLGIPLDNARFQLDGKTVLRGVFGGDLRLDSVSLGEATYTREAGKLHEIAAVRVSLTLPDGSKRILSDEELASGPAPCRIIAGRDVTPWPSSAIDAMGGLSVATMLINDGSVSVTIDLLFPAGMRDDSPGKVDRKPEAILVGPPPSGSVRLGAIVAGDLDEPVIAEGMIDVPPEAFEAGRSAAAVLFGNVPGAKTIAMVGYDLDDVGVHNGPTLGFRIEIPKGVIIGFKLFGCGESETDMLASADSSHPFLGAFEGGFIGEGSYGGEVGPLPYQGFPGNPPGSRTPFTGTDGGPPPNPPSPPIPAAPAPGAIIVLLGGLFNMTGRRRRS